MAEINLRPYQQRIIQECREALGKYRRVILQLATGGGKGFICGAIVSMSLKKGNRVLILSHRGEIAEQNANHIRNWGSEVAMVNADVKNMPTCDCVSAMAQTIRQRVKKEEWLEWFRSYNVVLLDECHRAEMDFAFEYMLPTTFAVGLSATPARYGSQRQLALVYRAMVTGVSIKELIQEGFLCKCRLYSLDAPKMDDVEWSSGRGDYNLGQMAQKFKSRAKYVGAVDNYERICNGEKCIVFCCSSEQTIEITKAFNERGIKAKYSLTGTFDEDEEYSGDRNEVLEEFKRGEFPVLVNYGIFTTGLDVRDIKVVILMFSTTSVVKLLQCLGRGARPHPSKNGEFICLDFGGNHERLGRYEDDRVFGLWHNTSAGGGVAPTKICPQCGAMIAVMYQDCPYCGAHFPTKQEVYEAELQEIAERSDGEVETLEQWVARKKLEGKKTNWILVNICINNPDNQKEAFMRAIEVLRTQHGEKLSPKYYFFFRKNILDKVKKRKSEEKNADLFGG